MKFIDLLKQAHPADMLLFYKNYENNECSVFRFIYETETGGGDITYHFEGIDNDDWIHICHDDLITIDENSRLRLFDVDDKYYPLEIFVRKFNKR